MSARPESATVDETDELASGAGRTARTLVPPEARPWGFIKRGELASGETPTLAESDITVWLDPDGCRFLMVSGKTVMQDLAPLEFVQLVRQLRHSTTQILLKFELRLDGSVGRPLTVWT